jgi:hypothetical protein
VARSHRLSGVDRWVAHPEALARVGGNGASRGLSLVETLDEFAWSLRDGLVPRRLDRFSVGREVVRGWAQTRSQCPDPASAEGGVASSSYLRTRLRELYRHGSVRRQSLVVMRARSGARFDTASLARSGELCEHGPDVRIGIVERSAAPFVAAACVRANPETRVWVEALPGSGRHLDRMLVELRGGPSPVPIDPSFGSVARFDVSATPRASPRRLHDLAGVSLPPDVVELLSMLADCSGDREALRSATQRYGESRKRAHVTFFESLSEVGALVDALADPMTDHPSRSVGLDRKLLDSIQTVADLCRPWALDGGDDAEAAAGLIDPVTGLPGRAYLRRRVRELHRGRRAPSARLVTVRIAAATGDLDGLVRRIRAAEFVRHVFSAADSLAVASPASFAAIVDADRAEALARRCRDRPGIVSVRAFRLVPAVDAMRA